MTTEGQPQRIGSYEVVDKLDAGGRVLKATDPASGRVVAVKVAPPELAQSPERVEKFQRDAQAIAQVNHPNVVRVLDHGEEAGVPFAVMELVEGGTLAAVMKRRRLTLQEALAVFKAVCKGLHAAHGQGIVHRDLNPDNVLVSDDLRVVKLSGFGLAKAESLSAQLGSLTTGQVNMGSLHYMSPEQASRSEEVDLRTDIYSVGVLFYELLTGRVPVGRFSLPSQLNNEVPPEVDPVILRCLETRPADRYQSAGQLIDALGRIEDRLRLGLMQELQGFSGSTSKILLRSTNKVLGGKAPLVLGALFALLVIVVLVVMLLSGSDESAPAPTAETPQAAAPAEQEAGSGAEPEPEAVADAGEPEPLDESVEEPGIEEAVVPPAAVAQAPAPAPGRATAPAPAPAQPAPGPSPAEQAAAARASQANEDLRVAMDKFAASLWDPAIADLQSFISQYGDHPRLPEVYLTVGKAHESKGSAQQALASYVEVQSRFPSSEQAIEARFRQAELTGKQRGRQEEARSLFNDLLREHPRSGFVPAALAAKGVLEKDLKVEVVDPQLGRVPAALQSFQSLVDSYPNHPAVEQALWELGHLWGDQRQYERSAESFAELGRRFPATRYEAWWEAGQVYDRRLNDRIRAIAAYENVPQSSPHYRDAQKRMQRLD